MQLKSTPPISGNTIALVCGGLFLLWLSLSNLWQVDVTQTKRHSLSPASIGVLKKLKGPVFVKVFLTDSTKNKIDLEQKIKIFFQRFHFHKHDLYLQFLNPLTHWQQAKQYRVSRAQQLVIVHQDKFRSVRTLNEANVVNSLLQITYDRDQWVVFLQGHGEKSPFDQLSQFADLLKQRQAKIQTLNLLRTPVIPRNTSLLVIAAPKLRLQINEVSLILRYINQGGNLLWLHDPGFSPGMKLIANRLGLKIVPGVVVDANMAQRRPSHLVLNDFNADNDIGASLRGFNCVFPVSAAFAATHTKTTSTFKRNAIIKSPVSSWSETQLKNLNAVRFDKNRGDIAGPLVLAYSLERTLLKTHKQQRIVVMGDSDFVSNNFINHGLNQRLGLNVFSWLANYDTLIHVQPPTQTDTLLNIGYPQIVAQAIFFMIALPTLLFIAAVWVPRKRQAHH